ncbi:DUF1127 domain-containing protein [Poseidonocella sp. HB161398]|uniref:DUF1127 domain-containing protein n=1 Tax=Poseidonocella sp. HB161398 TaxID=2320855 RepID=UPI0011087060|nr:DUF1127 domain-containing protein [Poseidonocella sp. HB161398]
MAHENSIRIAVRRGPLRAARAVLLRWSRNLRTRRALRRLPPERLGDPGLCPAAAAAEAARPFWG